MNIIDININELKAYENNPRNNELAVDKVAASIEEFGFKVPIIIDRDNVIIAGHTRLLAAKELGLEKVPCIIADDLTPEQVKAFRLADNKVSGFASWDFQKLSEQMEQLDDFKMERFGFETISFDDVDDFLSSMEIEQEMGSNEESEDEPDRLDETGKAVETVVCPYCGTEFEVQNEDY